MSQRSERSQEAQRSQQAQRSPQDQWAQPQQPSKPSHPVGAKPLPRRELLMVAVQPLADRLVTWLAGTHVQPHQVVLTHTGAGLLAAWLLAGDSWLGWLAAAVLLQVKSLLDNADGALARATGRVTQMGRYLDTLMDLVVNLALFLALAQHGPAWLALLAFAALTLVLSAEFNAMRRHLEEGAGQRMRQSAQESPAIKAEPPPAPPGAPDAVLTLLRGAYDLVLAPQDRALRALDERSFARAAGKAWPSAHPDERRRWADIFSVATMVDLGLTTQMLALGICAAVGLPYVYVILVLLQVPYVLAVQTVRLRRYRGAVQS